MNNQSLKNLNKRINALEQKAAKSKIPVLVNKSKKSNQVSPSSSNKKKNEVPASSIPTWRTTGRSIRVCQTERIGTISSSATANLFSATGFIINPANTTTFPWLSSVAALFDKYKFHKLRFIFSNNAGTSTAGQVAMAIDFDTLDATPANGTAMSNLAKAVQFAPWKSESIDVPVNRQGNNVWLFCEDAQSRANTNVDLKMYNLGNLFVSTEGMASSTVAGYLHVEYDVELIDKNPN